MDTTEANFGRFTWKFVADIGWMMQILRNPRCCERLDLEISWKEDLSRRLERLCEDDSLATLPGQK